MEERQQTTEPRNPGAPRGRGWQLEALASGFIAVLALLLSAYTVYVQRQQLKVQAWPRLALVTEVERGAGPEDLHVSVSLKNRGVAPAEVRSMRLLFDGEELTDWVDAFKRAKTKLGITEPLSLTKMDVPTGEIVGVGESFLLLASDSARTMALLTAANDDMSLSFCYCSVLDDCWILDLPAGEASSSTTTPVPRCPTYATKFIGVPAGMSKRLAERILDGGVKAGDAESAPAGANGPK